MSGKIEVSEGDVPKYVIPNTNNKACEETSLKKLILRTSNRYAEQTTVHGLWYVAKANHGLEKFCWLAIVSVAVFFSVFQTCSLYTQWQNSPVITTLETIALPIKDIEFPAVTICPQGSLHQTADAVLFKQLKEYIEDKQSKHHDRKKVVLE